MENNYTALYRKYRPRTFDDVVGQDVVIKTLKNSIINRKIAHAYLFAGPRGTGKTSVAKILAAAVNCEHLEEGKNIPCMECENCISIKNGINPDIIEMDAASNRGIDDIRAIIDKVKYRPLQSKYKVYIIDEVHMLTKDSFNALLKTLEEPPEHTIFILATTEPLKILTTIISRCQRYDFSRVDDEEIVRRMQFVIESENSEGRKIEYEESALRLIADLSNGGMRDALSILDQCLAYNDDIVMEDNVNAIYGITTRQSKLDLIRKTYDRDVDYIVRKIREYNDSGIDLKKLTEDLVNIYKEAFVYTTCNNEDLLKVIDREDAKELTDIYNGDELMQSIDILMDVMSKYENTKNIADYFEVSLLKVMALKKTTSVRKVRKEVEVKNQETTITISDDIAEGASEKVIDIQNNEQHIEVTMESDTVEIDDLPNDLTLDMDDEMEIIQQKPGYSLGFYLSILVAATKDEKEKDQRIISENRGRNYELSKMKFSNLLNEMEIVASARDVILVAVGIEAVANQINEGEFNKGIYEYFRNELNIDKMVYAITRDETVKLINSFVEKRKTDDLPEPAIITKYRILDHKAEEVSLEDKLIGMFGEDKVVIKES